jgi:hypothetical protein
MQAHYSHRSPRDLDLTMRVFQVDSSWYENYWLKERKPRPAGMVARNLSTMVSRLRDGRAAVLLLLLQRTRQLPVRAVDVEKERRRLV